MTDNNFFSLFELPVQLPIDMATLNSRYQKLQRQYHPDNFATAGESEKIAMVQKSASINAAYQALKDPVKAAEYRVSLAGLDIDMEHHTINDTDFLMEQFKLREQLDEIYHSNNYQALDLFYDEIMQYKKTAYSQLLILITQQNWLAAKNDIYKLRYFARLIEQIEALQEKQLDLDE